MRTYWYRSPFLLLLVSPICISAQTLQHRPAEPKPQSQAQSNAANIPLAVPAGTPIKVTIEKDLRIRRAGQPIDAKTIEPIYAFDKLLVPVGSEVKGRIAAVDGISKKTRTLSAMNADFSPSHNVHVDFDEIVLPTGKHIEMRTAVSPSAGILNFVTAKETKQSKVGAAEARAKGKLDQARQDVKQQIEMAKKQISGPDKMHRLERLALGQSPYRPQYLDAGTSFNADLQRELTFGSETLPQQSLATIGTLPPSGGIIHAWLTTPLSSSNSKKNDLVEAVLSQPLAVNGHLYLPQGTELRGTVLQVRAARWLGRNGQLRIAFHQIVLPDGPMREIEATLEGLEVAKGENLALDSEGGAQVKAPRSRYLSTGIAVALAASSAMPDEDNGGVHSGGLSGGSSGGAANGAIGFKLVGAVLGAAAHSQVVTAGLGAFGAAHSVYSHFLARGRDVVYPKDMSMVLAIGDAEKPGGKPVASQTGGGD